MQITLPWLKANFQAFNRCYFDSGLPEPRFHIGQSRTRLGSLSFKRKRSWGKVVNYDYALGMSNYYDQSEHQFQSVLLHEMIHYSIAYTGLHDSSPHGIVFRGMMDRLNRDGWDIHVTSSTRTLGKAGNAATKGATSHKQSPHLVLAIEMRDGHHFLSNVNPRFARELDSRLNVITEVQHFSWYLTQDAWFDNMPRVRSLRGRRVDLPTFREKTEHMTPLHLADTF